MINREEFFSKWQSATSPKEVADFYNITIKICVCRATYYRKRGIPFKRFKNRRNDLSKKIFIEIWKTSLTVKEVSERAKLTLRNCSSRASSLRAKGFKLKKFKKNSLARVVNIDNDLVTLKFDLPPNINLNDQVKVGKYVN